LTTGWDGTAKVWDATHGDRLLTFSGHGGRLSSGSWSPDATKIATTGVEDATVKVWDAATGEVLLTFSEHEGQIDRAEWSPEGTRIASVSRDMSAKVWDAATGQVLLDLYPETFGSVVLTLAWSADGSRIATYAGDGLLRVWDATSGEELSSIAGHGGDVFTISWFPSGERILSADSNGFVKVWDATNGTELFSVQIPNNGGVWLAPGAGRFLANASPNGPLRIFSIWGSLDELIDLTNECCVIRELTVEERELFGLPER
jgi:WD40 repeat protein